MSVFGARLRKIRLERGVSLVKLAAGIGFCRMTLHNWESGKTYPKSFETVLSVANFFHVSPDYFNDSASPVVTQEISILREEVSKLREELNALRRSICKSD